MLCLNIDSKIVISHIFPDLLTHLLCIGACIGLLLLQH